MEFDKNLLMEYKKILQTTELEKSYQEFIRLFKFVRVELEKEMPSYKFQGKIVENGMDYSYFQFTDDELKNKGLKIVVVFVHRTFKFEVWLSGYNRKIQCRYYNLFKSQGCVLELCDDPNRNDYILKLPLEDSFDWIDGNSLINKIKGKALKIIELAII